MRFGGRRVLGAQQRGGPDGNEDQQDAEPRKDGDGDVVLEVLRH